MLPQRWHYVPTALLQCRFLKLLQHCQLTSAKLSFPANWQCRYNQSSDVVKTLWQYLCVCWVDLTSYAWHSNLPYVCLLLHFLKKIKILFLLHEMKHTISNISKTTSESLSKILKIGKYKVILIFHISFFPFLKTLLNLWN